MQSSSRSSASDDDAARGSHDSISDPLQSKADGRGYWFSLSCVALALGLGPATLSLPPDTELASSAGAAAIAARVGILILLAVAGAGLIYSLRRSRTLAAGQFDRIRSQQKFHDDQLRHHRESVVAHESLVAQLKSDLERSENRYHSLVDATSAAVWIADANGDFTERQPSWEEFTGQTWECYRGAGWIEAVHPDDRQRVQAQWRQAIGQRGNCAFKGRIWHRKTGRYHYFTARAVPLKNSDGTVCEWIGAASDADEQMRAAEEAGAAKEAAEIANRAKGEFLANVSHELRTPMYGIVGMTELALDEELSSVVRDYLETAQGSAELLLKLVNEILDFSKLESGKFELETATFRLRSVVDEATKAFSVMAAEKGLELACDVAADVPDALIGDALRLRQILMNLINNAIKFSDQGDVVVRVRATGRSSDEVRLQFEVSDMGIGISQDDQNRIFAPFTQVDPSNTRRQGGTGLGLAIATELVRLMGGRLSVDSTPGRGSTFYFEVPLVPNLSVREEPAGGPGVRDELSRMQIMVVDDNATSRRILVELLERWELRPTVTSDAQSCLAELRQTTVDKAPFQIALVDALMSGVDGFTLVEQIQAADPPLAETVILMISAADRQTFRYRCEALKISAYLEKPISQTSLGSALANVMGAAGHEAGLQIASSRAEWHPSQSRRVLLAEDTVATQKIVKNILTKRGHAVEIASNGREVVEMLRFQPFDIVLMDVQMPIMDGLQATSAIRSLEASLGQRVPIVALTAHAMHGDRERCLAAGMDAYLVKPVSTANLIELVERFSSRSDNLSPLENPPASDSCGGAGDSDRRVFDMNSALARLGNDQGFFSNLVEFFLEDYPTLMAQIREALQNRDPAGVALAAHSLKGLVGNFDAHAAVRAAARLEKAGFDQDLTAAIESLEHELTQLKDALLPHRGKS
jgi:PAS domain S-box-containing protein